MGFGVISSAPCLAGVFVVCSFLFVTIWVAPENRAHEWQDSRLYCFNAGFSGVPNGPYAHVFNKGSDLVHKPAITYMSTPTRRAVRTFPVQRTKSYQAVHSSPWQRTRRFVITTSLMRIVFEWLIS